MRQIPPCRVKTSCLEPGSTVYLLCDVPRSKHSECGINNAGGVVLNASDQFQRTSYARTIRNSTFFAERPKNCRLSATKKSANDKKLPGTFTVPGNLKKFILRC